MRRLLLVVAAGVLVVAGCGDDGDVSTDDTAVETVEVGEALDLPDGTEVVVEGYVFAPDQGDVVMCERFGESYPPSCLGETLRVTNLDVASLPGLESTSGGDVVRPATWTTEQVQVHGTFANGVLEVS